MRVAVIGGTGVLGVSAIPALLDAGHEVVAVVDDTDPPEVGPGPTDGLRQAEVRLHDHDALVHVLEQVDAVCNFVAHVPEGLRVMAPRAWRANDRLRTDGVRRVVRAAREAHVRRLVQESASFVYADQGDHWIGEDAPVEITRATEPVRVGESQVQDFGCRWSTGVVLRFGAFVGDDPETRSRLRPMRHRHGLGLGSPDGWAHVVHTDDLGSAVVAALDAPSGVYNVGADPVLRRDLCSGLADVTDRDGADLIAPVVRRLGGVRLEPLARSQRVSSRHFTACTGWAPRRPSFEAGWLQRNPVSEALR